MLRRILFSRWLLSLIGVLLLALVVWVLGPLVDLLAGLAARLVATGGLLLLWLAANLALGWRHRRREAALAAGVIGAADPRPAEEVAAVREKLATAMAALRRASGRRGYLYEQPWYAIIGPPGAGKTTALLHAGLRFPLAATLGQEPVGGIAGTRLCEWWFAEEAVLIDTAGRYTTQDSDAAVDRAGWNGFLDLLRRTRPRQPLNGLLVAIGVPELLRASDDERTQLARTIRLRVKEVTDRLGRRLPVYVLFTKADLIAGFVEFFDDLDLERRGQAWGEMFDLAAGRADAGAATAWPRAMADLVGRLHGRLLTRLQAERSPERRALIAGFPAQAASLAAPLAQFLAETFRGSRLDPAPLLRGAFLTSGTQDGTPIDRLARVLAGAFDLDLGRLPSLRPQKGRSYFLAGALGAILGEAMLAASGRATQQRAWRRAGLFGGVAALTLAIGCGLLLAAAAQRAATADVATRLACCAGSVHGVPLDPVTDATLAPVAPLLACARDLAQAQTAAAAGWHLPLGLSRATGRTVAATFYRQTLQRVLLPRLLLRLEAAMRAHLRDPDALYPVTRAYLMLAGEGTVDAGFVRAVALAVSDPDPVLADHVDALLHDPLPPVPWDAGIVADARATFSRDQLPSRIFARIRLSDAAQALPDWRADAATGPTGAAHFVLKSGEPFSRATVPGFLTVAGFHCVLLAQLPTAAREAADDSWVLGPGQAILPTDPEMQGVRAAVVKLYEAEYERAWDRLMANMGVGALGGAEQAQGTLYVLGAPQGPLASLLRAIAAQLQLTKPPEGGCGATGRLAEMAKDKATEEINRKLGQHAAAGPPPGQDVDDYYKPFREFVGNGPGAPLEEMLATLSDLSKQPPGASGPATQALKAQAGSAPPMVAGMAATLAGGATQLNEASARQALAEAYNGPDGPGPLCERVVSGNYPFVRGAASDAPIDDFARLFAPQGLFAQFFLKLQPYVDTSGAEWRPRDADGMPAPVSRGEVAAMQAADRIRQVFFAASAEPGVRFGVTPEDLDASSTRATLTIGSTDIPYEHGPLQEQPASWPDPKGVDVARLTFEPDGAPLEARGPWALYRLLNEQGQLARAGSAATYTVGFAAEGHSARYTLRARTAQNPFDLSAVRGFSCPRME